jgi:hypothetical protein
MLTSYKSLPFIYNDRLLLLLIILKIVYLQGFDMAKGMSDIKAIYRSGWLIVGLAIILSAYIAWFMPTTLPVGDKVEQRK